MAQRVSAHTNHKYLTHEQLRDLLKEHDETILALKRNRLTTSRRFLMAVATGDMPRLQQLIRQAMKEGAGLSQIISKIEDSILGIYQARGYEGVDFDVAITLRHHSTFTQIMPSPGVPTPFEILFNIREIFLPRVKTLGDVVRSGMSLFWDEVSQEEQACYLPYLDKAGGFCREHIHQIST
ncbi:hypothetical protein JAAARDRAFT_200549 [Jaapia argillacea MUCL 33604]|uniref:Uncharacterized protein n=1 Tax=Jaapia argillacea MUCL 33604 TaxID=933084 RepID=A0A067PH53_9AGAM|nr:hypothetical protein JAAARDRAFT_200549 [Jaapia argillacea MUCL 33604]